MTLKFTPTPIDKITKDRKDRATVIARLAPLVDAIQGAVNEIIKDHMPDEGSEEITSEKWQQQMREFIIYRLAQSENRNIRILDFGE